MFHKMVLFFLLSAVFVTAAFTGCSKGSDFLLSDGMTAAGTQSVPQDISSDNDSTKKVNPKGAGMVLFKDTRKQSNKIDDTQIKVSNGKKLDLEKAGPVRGWFGENTLVAAERWIPKELELIDTSNGKEKIISPKCFSEDVELLDYYNGKLLLRNIKSSMYGIYDISSDTLKDIGSFKPCNSAGFIDDKGRYAAIQCSDVINKSTSSKINIINNNNSYIVDTETGKWINFNENLVNDFFEDRQGKINVCIAYSYVDDKFYTGIKNRIYEFDFSNPDKPKLIKDLGKLDIMPNNFQLSSGDKGLLFDAGEWKTSLYDGYLYTFENSALTKITGNKGKRTGSIQYDTFYYNKERNLMFVQLADEKSDKLEPCIVELRGTKLVTREKVFAPEQLNDESANGYSALWNNDGSKLLLSIYSYEMTNSSGTAVQAHDTDNRVISIAK